MTLYTQSPAFTRNRFKFAGQDIFWQESSGHKVHIHINVYNHHQVLSVRAGVPRLRPCCARLFASNSRSNFRAFPSSPWASHVIFQCTLYSVPDTVSLSCQVSLRFPTPAPRLVLYHRVPELA